MTYTSEGLSRSLSILRMEMDEVDWTYNSQYAIFGSASLVIQGVLQREPGDIDVMMTRRLWGTILAERPDWQVETPKAGDPPMLVYNSSPIHISAFFDWSSLYVDMDMPHLISTAETVKYLDRNYKVIPVQAAWAHKRDALKFSTKEVQKHVPDIQAIEEWINDSNT